MISETASSLPARGRRIVLPPVARATTTAAAAAAKRRFDSFGASEPETDCLSNAPRRFRRRVDGL
jgi:hypothetical protein